MTLQEIASRLADYCRSGNYTATPQELYSRDAESPEPVHSPVVQSVKGPNAIIAKGKQFQSMPGEIHGGSVSDPIIATNHFCSSR